MRLPSMIATVIVLIAVVVGISGLTGFGFSWWEIVKLLFPIAVGVAFLSWLIFQLGIRSARWLNREEDEDRQDS